MTYRETDADGEWEVVQEGPPRIRQLVIPSSAWLTHYAMPIPAPKSETQKLKDLLIAKGVVLAGEVQL